MEPEPYYVEMMKHIIRAMIIELNDRDGTTPGATSDVVAQDHPELYAAVGEDRVLALCREIYESIDPVSDTVNTDNLDLQPLYAGRSTIGFVDEVNGPGAREVPEYTPTRAELLELIRYWESKFLDAEYFMFEHSQAGSREIRLGPYAARRVDRIVELLGDEGEKGVRGVRDDFAKSVGSSNWEDFCRYLGPYHLHGAADGQ